MLGHLWVGSEELIIQNIIERSALNDVKNRHKKYMCN